MELEFDIEKRIPRTEYGLLGVLRRRHRLRPCF